MSEKKRKKERKKISLYNIEKGDNIWVFVRWIVLLSGFNSQLKNSRDCRAFENATGHFHTTLLRPVIALLATYCVWRNKKQNKTKQKKWEVEKKKKIKDVDRKYLQKGYTISTPIVIVVGCCPLLLLLLLQFYYFLLFGRAIASPPTLLPIH